MQRLKAFSALLLTAFFAVAGSFHHHPIPKPTHDHAGFCSAASAGIALETCALCRVAGATVTLAAQAIASFSIDRASHLVVVAVFGRQSAGASLLCDPRAPPAV